MQVIDLHCDLLSYLAEGQGKADNPKARCSWPQLKAGGVALQTMAVFTETSATSTLLFQKQADAYQNLPTLYPEHFSRLTHLTAPLVDGKIHTLVAIENASGLALEDEPLNLALRRLEEFIALCQPVFYISLTWNTENRFGGGCHCKVGLKRDGEILLEALSGKQIALDLSHTSDALAYDLLNYIDKKNLNLIPIASHSNYREVCANARNLPDEFASEIVRRGGIIGLNLVRSFVGSQVSKDVAAHLQHAQNKGWWDHICFGADFFFENQIRQLMPSLYPFFEPPFDNASCYPHLLELLTSHFDARHLKQLTHLNALQFMKRLKESVYAHSR